MSETPAARMLTLLEMLQARPSATGTELAAALGVSERSLRRYVQRLVDLGIPVVRTDHRGRRRHPDRAPRGCGPGPTGAAVPPLLRRQRHHAGGRSLRGRLPRRAPVDHLISSLAAVPYPLDVDVVLHCDLEHARRLVPATVGTVEAHPDGARLRIGAASADWAARHLVGLGVRFTLLGPDEVRRALLDLADENRTASGLL